MASGADNKSGSGSCIIGWMIASWIFYVLMIAGFGALIWYALTVAHPSTGMVVAYYIWSYIGWVLMLMYAELARRKPARAVEEKSRSSVPSSRRRKQTRSVQERHHSPVSTASVEYELRNVPFASAAPISVEGETSIETVTHYDGSQTKITTTKMADGSRVVDVIEDTHPSDV